MTTRSGSSPSSEIPAPPFILKLALTPTRALSWVPARCCLLSTCEHFGVLLLSHLLHVSLLVRLREAGSSQFDPLLVLLYVRYIARYFEAGPLAGRLQLCLRDQHYNSYRTRVVLTRTVYAEYKFRIKGLYET